MFNPGQSLTMYGIKDKFEEEPLMGALEKSDSIGAIDGLQSKGKAPKLATRIILFENKIIT